MLLFENKTDEERQELMNLITRPPAVANAEPDSDDWVPSWWSGEESAAQEAASVQSWMNRNQVSGDV